MEQKYPEVGVFGREASKRKTSKELDSMEKCLYPTYCSSYSVKAVDKHDDDQQEEGNVTDLLR